MKREELLKLASDLEALSSQDFSDIDALSIYKQLVKEAKAKVNDEEINQALISIMDKMQEYAI